ncbi:MAG TPA: MG2 domain-containing protein, partial [Bacteroidales bacterium]
MKTKFFLLTAIILMNGLCSIAQQFDYGVKWIKINFDELNGLPKSALATADQIFIRAQRDKNYPQFLKAFVYKMKYKSMLQENAFVDNLLEAEIMTDSAGFPVKQILHSMLAEMYWWYFENNRYNFYNRSRTSQFSSTDINTWDLYQLVAKVIEHYKLSLTESDRSKITQLDDFSEMLQYYQYDQGNKKPTLYDFLALRAIDFFKNDEPNLTRPSDEFSMNNDDFFLPADTFCKIEIKTTDTLSFKYYAISLLQDLLRFHLNDSSPETMTNIDMKRLEFAYEYSQNVQKDSLYLKNLSFLEKKCLGKECGIGVGMKIAECLYNLGEKYDPRKSDVFKWEKKKAHEKCLKILQGFPAHARECKGLLAKIEQQDVQITIEKENIPNEPFRALVDYHNLDTVFLRVIRTSYKEMDSMHVAYNRISRKKYINWDPFVIDYFRKKKAVKSFSVKVSNDHDYQTHYAEIKIPAMENGLYLILAGTNAKMDYDKKVVNYGFTEVTNISFINRKNNDGTNDFYLLNRKTGAPLQNVKTECWSYKYDRIKRESFPQLLTTVTSDKDGFIHFSHKELQQEGFYLNFIYNGDYFSNRDPESFSGYNLFYNSWTNDAKHYQTNTFFFTDRSIYRPGQTIYFKGIVIKTDGDKENSIQPNYTSQVSLYDANSQKLSEISLTTNEYGSFSGTFTAPSSGLNGLMSIRNESGSLSFSVEDYKRPKFEVKFDSIKETYKLGEMVSIHGKAVAYSGANIDNASVKYRVVRKTRFPRWEEFWWNPFPSSPEKEITQGTIATDDGGQFVIKFKAIPDETVSSAANPIFNYIIYADVTDLNGETHSAEKTINAGYKVLTITMEIPGKIDRNAKNEYKISSTNTN